MGFVNDIKQDYKSNKGNTKGCVVIILFRIASHCQTKRYRRILFYPYLFIYKHLTQILFSVELPAELRMGTGTKVFHGFALIVHENTVIGNNCVLRQSTTIGNARPGGKCPIIGDNVEIGCNVCIIGDVRIGNNVIIGAGSIVIKDVPPNSVVVGNPGHVVKTLPPPQTQIY